MINSLTTIRTLIAKAPAHMTDMSVSGNPGCGTPGCIMGWADPTGVLLFWEIYKELGLTRTQGDNLSLGLLPSHRITSLHITKAEVLAAVDSMIADPNRVMPAWPQRVVEALS